MNGAEIQLVSFGQQAQYLSGNPSMTFFKAVYRQYTNFAMEDYEIVPDGPGELSESSEITLKFTLNKRTAGDLLTHLYLQFDLPDIYSGYNPNVTDSNLEKSSYRFQWIESLGTNIINYAKMSINGRQVNLLHGSWIRVWHELFSTVDMKTFDAMIGNTPDMFSPEHAIGAVGVYPTSTLDPELNSDPELFTSSAYVKNSYLKPPSILGRTVTVPLSFYFTTSPGLAFPLVSLDSDELQFEIELRPLSQLYTVVDVDEKSTTFGKRVVPDPTIETQNIQNFLANRNRLDFQNGVSLSSRGIPYAGWGFRPRFLANFVYLEEDQRAIFAEQANEYLIEVPQRFEFRGLTGTTTQELKLLSPSKALIWMAQRDDFENSNIFGNFTNWPNSDIYPGTLGWIRNSVGENSQIFVNGRPVIVDTAFQAFEQGTIAHKFNFAYYNRYPIRESTIYYNGKERLSTKRTDYFNYLQPYQHKIVHSVPGVNLYSFALEPSRFQPTGHSDMSEINKIELRTTMTDVPVVEDVHTGNIDYQYKYNLIVYTIGTNILRVFGGQANIVFQQ